MASKTMQRSIKLMKERGYYVEVVERYNMFIKRRHDLFNLFDLLCLKDGSLVGVQTSTLSERQRHLEKLKSNPLLHEWRKVTGTQSLMHSWRKLKKRNASGKRLQTYQWVCQEESL